MEIEEGLVAHLAAQPELVDLIGDRLFVKTYPPGTELPAVVFTRVSSLPSRVQEREAKTHRTRFQFDVFARDREDGATGDAQAKAVARQLQAALDDFTGMMGSVEVPRVFLEENRDVPEDEEIDGGSRVARVLLEFTVWHRD